MLIQLNLPPAVTLLGNQSNIRYEPSIATMLNSSNLIYNRSNVKEVLCLKSFKSWTMHLLELMKLQMKFQGVLYGMNLDFYYHHGIYFVMVAFFLFFSSYFLKSSMTLNLGPVSVLVTYAAA